MKNLILILLLILPFLSYSQEPLMYSEVVELPGISKDELFIRGRAWFNENFKSSKDVLQVADKETGELLGKGIMGVFFEFKMMGTHLYKTDVSFQMNIWVKDGKYKYEMSNFYDPGDRSGNCYAGQITTSDVTDYKMKYISEKKMNEYYLSIKIIVQDKAQDMIKNLKSSMSKKAESSNF